MQRAVNIKEFREQHQEGKKNKTNKAFKAVARTLTLNSKKEVKEHVNKQVSALQPC